MAIDTEALKTEVAKPAYAGMSPAEKAEAINALTFSSDCDVSVADIEGYLGLNLLRTAIEDWVAAFTLNGKNADQLMAWRASRELIHILNSPRISVVKTAIPETKTKISQLLGLMVASEVGGMTMEHYTVIMSMSVVQKPLWEKFGSRKLDHGDILQTGA